MSRILMSLDTEWRRLAAPSPAEPCDAGRWTIPPWLGCAISTRY